MEERKRSESPVDRSHMEVAWFYIGAFYRAEGQQVEVCSLECRSTGLQPCGRNPAWSQVPHGW